MRFEKRIKNRKKLLSVLALLVIILMLSLMNTNWMPEAQAQGTVPTEAPTEVPSTSTPNAPDPPGPADTATSTPVSIFPSPTATTTPAYTPSSFPTGTAAGTLMASSTPDAEGIAATEIPDGQGAAGDSETPRPVPPFIPLVPIQPRRQPPSLITVIAAVLIGGVLIWAVNRYMR